VNYPARLRLGLLAPCLLRTGVCVSVSELVRNSSHRGFRLRNFPSQVVSECATPTGWTLPPTDCACFLSHLNTVEDVASIALRYLKHKVINIAVELLSHWTTDNGTIFSGLLTRFAPNRKYHGVTAPVVFPASMKPISPLNLQFLHITPH